MSGDLDKYPMVTSSATILVEEKSFRSLSLVMSNTTFLAVTGLSPAIVTETLWALAHQDPPVIPQRVSIVTTTAGAVAAEEQLFTRQAEWGDQSPWEALRRDLGATSEQLIAEPIHVISLPDAGSGRERLLDDIRTPMENDAAAEFIFSRVWEVVRDADRRLIASVAGGRKTMGALLHSAVSLIGREQDQITHVLVNPPYDTLRGFFYPAQRHSPLLDVRSGSAHEASDAHITLAQVPFVPLRNRFKELDELPASFLGLRRALGEQLTRDAERLVPIRINHKQGQLCVDNNCYQIRPRALAILHFILKCNEKGSIPPNQTVAADSFTTWFGKHRMDFGTLNSDSFSEDDFRRELNYIRLQLKKEAWQPALRTLQQAPFQLEIVGG